MSCPYLDDLAQRATSLLKNSLHALTGSLGLVGDATFNEVAVLVSGNLTRDKDLTANLDGLAL